MYIPRGTGSGGFTASPPTPLLYYGDGCGYSIAAGDFDDDTHLDFAIMDSGLAYRAQVGRLLDIPAIFDTDDGRAAGVHFWSAAPFAHVITTPDCIGEHYGRRHVQYPGYKQTAYLHPNHFTPDRSVLVELGVRPGERLFIARFVEMVASHDISEGAWMPHGALSCSRLDVRGVTA